MKRIAELIFLLGVLIATIVIGSNFDTTHVASQVRSSVAATANDQPFLLLAPNEPHIPAIAFPDTHERNVPQVPARISEVPNLEIEARAVYAVEARSGTVLLEKNAHTPFPIASLTKLAAALTALDLIPEDSLITVSKEAIAQDGIAGDLRAGEKLSRNDLLATMLIPSSNDAAWALAEYIGVPTFVAAMNAKAHTLGLSDSTCGESCRTIHFVNPNGLDADGHFASASDVATLLNATLQEPSLAHLLGSAEFTIKNNNGIVTHHLKSTDNLLGVVDGIVGAKTGYTDEAKGALAVAFLPIVQGEYRYRNSDTQQDVASALLNEHESLVILVILGSPDRFSETEALIRWVREAYSW